MQHSAVCESKIRRCLRIFKNSGIYINEEACQKSQDKNPVQLRQRKKRCFQEDWWNGKEYFEVSEINRIDSIPLFKINLPKDDIITSILFFKYLSFTFHVPI